MEHTVISNVFFSFFRSDSGIIWRVRITCNVSVGATDGPGIFRGVEAHVEAIEIVAENKEQFFLDHDHSRFDHVETFEIEKKVLEIDGGEYELAGIGVVSIDLGGIVASAFRDEDTLAFQFAPKPFYPGRIVE